MHRAHRSQAGCSAASAIPWPDIIVPSTCDNNKGKR